MIVIDEERCTGCGTCVKICHQHCLSIAEGKVRIDYAVCSTCTQCIAACPERALSWDGAVPLPFDPARLPSSQQLEELFQERRSVRDFQPRPIERELLARIVAAGSWAPTNNYALRAVVLEEPEGICEMDRAVVGFTSLVYRLFYKSRPVFRLLGLLTPGMTSTDKVKMESVLARGQNFRSFPAAMVFLTGDRRTALSVESAQCALANMFYYAQALGIAGCLFGPGKIVLDRSRPVRRRLGLDRREHILGTLLLGYPAVKFRNKVEGKRLPVRWL
jgi:NAD-dependent dihydropyrimidine dehydrogenase PreA subunit/nitroreductase